MKFHIRTLGCKMNWLDSARVSAQLLEAGHTQTTEEADADIVLINSCTVTGQADRKSRQETRSALRLEKEVAVIGCGPWVDDSLWQKDLPGAQIFSSEEALFDALGIEVSDQLPPANSRTRLPVAIQTGCDNLCQFCITRVARGTHQSLPLETITTQINQASEMGVQEVILTGINLGAWGCDDSRQAKETKLPHLLNAILEKTSIPRVRISSLGPQYLDKAFFDIFTDQRLCDHLHLSVQSGSEAVLNEMQRWHGVEEVLRIAEVSRKARPRVAITADFITGFPGETDLHFGQTLDFAAQVGFAKLHVFPYSEREGTAAAIRSDQIASNLRKERAKELRNLGRELRTNFLDNQLGLQTKVLVESAQTGLSSNYIRLRTPGDIEGAIVSRQISIESLAE